MFQLPSLYVGVHKVSAQHADLVGDLQKFLLGLEYRISVDENFGPQTKWVLQQYQSSKNIVADGIVGPKTWGYLLADDFRPKDFVQEREGSESDPNYPPKPLGAFSPNGLLLFGKGFKYTPKPLPSMPEYVVPDPAWVRQNIGTAEIPQLVGVRGARADGSMLFNKALIPQVEALFAVWEDLGNAHLIETFSGSWVPRFVRGRSDRLSNHSFGSALDLNAAWNGFRRQPALVGRRGSVRELVKPAYDLGFFWGGWYNDGMHLEAYKRMSAQEIERVVDQLRKEAA